MVVAESGEAEAVNAGKARGCACHCVADSEPGGTFIHPPYTVSTLLSDCSSLVDTSSQRQQTTDAWTAEAYLGAAAGAATVSRSLVHGGSIQCGSAPVRDSHTCESPPRSTTLTQSRTGTPPHLRGTSEAQRLRQLHRQLDRFSEHEVFLGRFVMLGRHHRRHGGAPLRILPAD